MKIKYDKRLNLIGIGISPWPRLGPERWFDSYKIASFYDWDLNSNSAPQVHSIQQHNEVLPKSNTSSLLNNELFHRLLEDNFKGYSALTYKSINNQDISSLAKLGIRALCKKPTVSLENKAEFRRIFRDKLPFPRHTTYESPAMLNERVFSGTPIVLQDETLSGGKGTYIVKDIGEFRSAVQHLQTARSNKKAIVSELIDNGSERSLQCCVTRYGVFVGPLQKQLMGIRELQNPNSGGNKFCGIEISSNDSARGLYSEMYGYCKMVGQYLYETGYRGIFGIDFLISKTGQIYILEVNQRLTGATPVLDMFYRAEQDIPFYLLHVLELANLDYEISNIDVNEEPSTGSMVILHSQESKTSHVSQNIKSGLYTAELGFKKQSYRLSGEEDSILAQRYIPTGASVKPGERLAVAFFADNVLDKSENLRTQTKEVIGKLYDHIELE